MIPSVAAAFGTKPGVIPGVTAVGGTLHSYTLTNTNGAGTSKGFNRVGLAFVKADVPSGRILQAQIGETVLRSSMLSINTWSDGSLRSCILCVDAGDFTASQAKTINVSSVVGSQSASGLNVSTALNAIDDLTVEVTNHSGSSSGALANRTYSLQTAIATAARLETTDDTDLCVRLDAWQKVVGEEHLTCKNFVDIWLDDQGNVEAVEWTPVLSQHWMVDDPDGVSQTKERRDYDATIKSGTTTLASHTGLQHAYYCSWAGLRTDNDDQHARRFWIDAGAAMPTLNLAYSVVSKGKLADTGYLPPLTTTAITKTFGQVTHTPLGEDTGGTSHNHREAINGTGGYEGRGAITNPDSIALINQTAAAWRAARVSAQAGLSVFFHIRDHRTASGGFANGDISFGLIPFKFEQLGAQTYTGLAAEAIASLGSGSEIVQDAPVGGAGAFSNYDISHHVNYSYAMAFIEGEAYLKDAVYSAAMYPLHEQNYNEFGTRPFLLYYNTSLARRTAQSIPSDRYGGSWLRPQQERSTGLVQQGALRALQLAADNDRHQAYFKKGHENGNEYLADSLSYFPTAHTDKGGWPNHLGSTGGPWMTSFGALAFWDTVPIADDEGWAGYRTAALQCDKLIANGYANDPNALTHYTHMYLVDDPANALVYAPADETLIIFGGPLTSDVITATPFTGLAVRDDDFIYLSFSDDQGNALTAPSGLSINVKYFAVNSNPGAGTFQLSATQGGAAITGITDSADVGLGGKIADASTLSPIGSGSVVLPSGDDFAQINYAAAQLAARRGSANFSAQLNTDIRTFYAPKVADWVNDDYAAWSYDSEL